MNRERVVLRDRVADGYPLDDEQSQAWIKLWLDLVSKMFLQAKKDDPQGLKARVVVGL